MATTTRPAPVSVTLSENVYEVDFEFRSTARLVFDMIDSDPSEEIVRTAVEIVRDAMGTDPVKLYGLIDVAHDKIVNQRKWAQSGAVRFYRELFMQLDLGFLEDVGIERRRASGAGIAVKKIIDKCMAELDDYADWRAHRVACMLDFVDNSFDNGDDLVTAAAASNVVGKMATSFYLFFDENLPIFLEYCLRIVLRIDALHPKGKSEHLTKIFKQLRTRSDASPSQGRMIEGLLESIGRSHMELDGAEEVGMRTLVGVTNYHRAVPMSLEDLEAEVKGGLQLFAKEPDWTCSAVVRLIDGVSDGMKIGAPRPIEDATYDLLEAMVNSDMILVGGNLKTLAFFLLRIGPALDAMASSSQSQRLTIVIGTLNDNSGEQTDEHRRDIEGLRRNMGRLHTDTDELPSNDHDGDEENVFVLI